MGQALVINPILISETLPYFHHFTDGQRHFWRFRATHSKFSYISEGSCMPGCATFTFRTFNRLWMDLELSVSWNSCNTLSHFDYQERQLAGVEWGENVRETVCSHTHENTLITFLKWHSHMSTGGKIGTVIICQAQELENRGCPQ